jgi:hypothetical protein
VLHYGLSHAELGDEFKALIKDLDI